MAVVVPIVGLQDSIEFASVASPTIFTILNGVTSVTISGDKVASEKTTQMGSAGGVDTYISSTQEPGTCDVKAFFAPGDTTQVALEAIRAAGSIVAFKVLYGSSNSCAFSGIVESLTPAWPLEKPATLDVKIKITGPKTYV